VDSQAVGGVNQSCYIIGIDTGGTFTDVAVLTPDGETIINKAATTPGDFSSGVMNALQVTAESMGMDRAALLRRSSVFKHGTTVATNAMITRTGSKVGLLTTKGHEDAIFIMRAVGRVDGLDEMEIRHVTKVTKPEPLVQRPDVRGVYERLNFRGDVLAPLDEDDAREAIRYLVEERGVDAIAVCLLFGWKNPAHEKRVVELIGEMYHNRGLTVTASHAIAPMSGEYARINTTVANSFLDRTMRGYVDELRRRLHREGLREGAVMLMQGNGGIVRPEEMTAVGSLQSGPAGGMIATEYIASKLSHDNVITTDMGGTSFDVGILTLGALHYARAPIVERARLLQPLIQVESIGAGGGTIAGVDPLTRRLLVGPASAGADPGPVAYGMGGKAVTVTDANIVLGYINPDYFLGGRRKLDRKAAEQAITSDIAEPLGLSTIEAAAGIYDVVNSKMSDLIRKQVVRSGTTPEDYVMYAFGGAGPAHAAAYGADLGVKKIYVFPVSPAFSAFGVATANVIHTTLRTCYFPAPIDIEALRHELDASAAELAEVMAREGFGRSEVTFRRTLYMRYTRQTNDVELSIPDELLKGADLTELERMFNSKYEALYGSGSTHSQAGVEVIAVSVDAIGATPKPQLKRYPMRGPDSAHASKGTRPAYFTIPERGFHDTTIYDYTLLQPGNRLTGPGIIETPFTTVVVPPGLDAELDQYRNVILLP
jgi:N-methylhydantoinase A